jgi:hypothetical protein
VRRTSIVVAQRLRPQRRNSINADGDLRAGLLAVAIRRRLAPPTPRLVPVAAPREAEGLQRGHAAQLIFEIEGTEEDGSVSIQAERMWVIVAERVGDAYIGILDNQPVCLEPSDDVYLRFGAEVPFRPEHIINIGEPPVDYADWQLGQPPERLWPRDA